MAMTPTTFITGVSTLIRLGRSLYDEYRLHLLEAPYETLLPPAFSDLARDPVRMRSLACAHIASKRKDLWEHGGPLSGMFEDPTLASTALSPAGEAMLGEIMQVYFEHLGLERHLDQAEVASFTLNPDKPDQKKKLPISRSMVLVHKEWMTSDRPGRWARLGLNLVDIALDVVAAEPQALGLNRRAAEIVGALAANLSELVDDEPIAADAAEKPGERLVRYFMRASLETIAERPELFVSAERWKPIVSGVVLPLKEQLLDGDGDLELITRERLSNFLRGPVAHSVLTALNANADSFLTGRFGGDQALGAAARAVLGAITSPRQGDFDLAEIFSGEGAVLLFESALGVAKDRPELFIRGIGAEADAGREFLSRVAASLDSAPEPFGKRSGLAPQIAALAMEVAGAYASRRLRTGESDDPWASAGLDVADQVIGRIVAGFRSAAQDGGNPFERLFDREQALDVLRIVATRVAETPHMLVGSGASTEVANIAQGVAEMLKADPSGLIDGAGWRTIVARTVDLVARNPGVLFDVDAPAAGGQPDLKSQIAFKVVSRLLARAGSNMAEGRRPGAILFGDTLREAILATLEAASSKLLIPAGAIADNVVATGDADAHLEALDAFIAHLLSLADGPDPVFRMGADEWLYVYRYFVAHILAEGPSAFPPPGGADPGASPSRVTDAIILEVIQGAAHRYLQDRDGGEVG